jgi:peptide/nickel transport system ATP-binding protein
LLEAFPDLNRPISTGEEAPLLATIPGAPPALDSLPPGCRFEPRCQLPEALRLQVGCRQASPPLVDVTAFSAELIPVSETSGQAAPAFLRQHFSACYFAGRRMDETEETR